MPGVPDEFGRKACRAPTIQLLTAMHALMPELSVADQARLQPFIVRPTDPRSVFAPHPAAMAGLAAAADPADPANPTATCTKRADPGSLIRGSRSGLAPIATPT